MLYLSFKLSTKSYKGYKHIPLVKTIDYRNCVPDILHLILRITDKLEDLILEKIAYLDSTGRPHNRDINKQPNFMKFIKILEKFGVTGSWRYDGGEAKKRQLTGDEKWKILKNLGKEDDDFLYNNFRELENAKIVNKVCFSDILFINIKSFSILFK